MSEQFDIARVAAQADLPAIAAAFTEVKQRGAEYQARCPFHSPDNNPSLYIYQKGGKWNYKCFACGEAGDSIDWIEKLEGLDTVSAAKRLGGDVNWTPLKAQPPTKKREPVPERITSKPPAGVQAPAMTIRQLGEPSRVWPYRDAQGDILGYVARYDSAEGKQFRCWTWGARGDAEPGWGCGHWNSPRPLYGMDKLAARRNDPVLVVEGEKAADAAALLLPAYVVVSWPGGSQSWHRADWSVLKGRHTLLWPDNDEPGIECMDKLAALLADPRGLACKVRTIDPNRMPDGFDAADWTGTSDELIAWAKPRARDYKLPAPQPSTATVNPAPSQEGAGQGDVAAAGNQKPPRKPKLAIVGNTALAPAEDAEALPAAMSEDALADHFALQHSPHWRYVKVWNAWFEWRGDGWHEDKTGKVDRLAVEVTRKSLYWAEAASLTPDGKRRVNSKRTAGALRDIAMSDRRIAATVDQWNRDPWLLGVPGGVVDLKKGRLLEARPDHYITRRTLVSPADGDCPYWMALLERATQGDKTLLDYLRRLCGYVLTGETREECFAFVYGPAQTGKSTFIRVISDILGDYHCKASMDTFTESRHERHAEELAVLVGARLVTSVETEEGKRWNESRIKALTGRDRIRARFMRENSFEFDPQFKIIIAGNHAPHLRNVDEAMRRRLHIIPFTHPISMEERDDQLAEKLRAEYPQILAWMVRGAAEWSETKLGRPGQIAQAVDDYLEAEDTFGEWLSECTERSQNARCLSGGAYKAFRNWAEKNGEHTMSQKRFVQVLKERGFETTRSNGSRYISGLSLKTDEPAYVGYEVP